MRTSAQTTIEYLIILAVVITLVLVVVSAWGDLSLGVVNANNSQAKSNWGKASPFAVVDWTPASQTNLLLVLRNNSYEKISFNAFHLSGTDFNSTKISEVLPGEEFTISISPALFSAGCISGKSYSFAKDKIWIDYNTAYANNLIENAPDVIWGTC